MSLVFDERRKQNVATTCGALCFLIGIIAAILGSVLISALWIVGAGIHPWLKVTGTALLVAVIPLVLGAGCCLDWSERRKQQNQNQHTPSF